MDLVRQNALNVEKEDFFVLDEWDKGLVALDMRRDVQEILKETFHEKQVMMFTAILSKDRRVVSKTFMKNTMDVFVDDDTQLDSAWAFTVQCKSLLKQKNIER